MPGPSVGLSFARAGQVTRLVVLPGDRVARGANLATLALDPASREAYLQATNALALVRREADRLRELLALRLATQSQVDTAGKAVLDAAGDVTALDANVGGAAASTISAPFDGVVASVAVAQGDRVAAGAPILQLAHADSLRVQIGVEPGQRRRVRVGMKTTLTPIATTADPSQTTLATVSSVQDAVDPKTQLVSAIVNLPRAAGGPLVPGMKVRAALQVGLRNLLTVPRNAVLSDGQGAETRLATRRIDPTVFPIVAYSLTSSTVSPTDLRTLADYRIAPQLSGVPGVAHADALGSAVEEFHVVIDPMRLQACGLTLDDVSRTLGAANVISAVGRIEDRYKLLLMLTDSSLHTPEQIGRTVISRGANGLVRLADVATLQRSTVPQWTRVTADGRDAVLVSIYQQAGNNSVRIATDVKALLATLRTQLPPGITVANWYDQSELVTASAASVRDAILVGALLAAGVLLLFLRNLKVTLIAVAVVPTVLAATVLVLNVLGMSFNVMTLGGMAAAVCLVIDDAIVMTEHIVRRLRQKGDAARRFAAGWSET